MPTTVDQWVTLTIIACLLALAACVLSLQLRLRRVEVEVAKPSRCGRDVRDDWGVYVARCAFPPDHGPNRCWDLYKTANKR